MFWKVFDTWKLLGDLTCIRKRMRFARFKLLEAQKFVRVEVAKQDKPAFVFTQCS